MLLCCCTTFCSSANSRALAQHGVDGGMARHLLGFASMLRHPSILHGYLLSSLNTFRFHIPTYSFPLTALTPCAAGASSATEGSVEARLLDIPAYVISTSEGCWHRTKEVRARRAEQYPAPVPV